MDRLSGGNSVKGFGGMNTPQMAQTFSTMPITPRKLCSTIHGCFSRVSTENFKLNNNLLMTGTDLKSATQTKDSRMDTLTPGILSPATTKKSNRTQFL